MKKGFTLIETIIYIALFTILIGAGFFTAFQLIQSGDSLNTKTVVNSELDFVLRKIDWAMNGARTIDTPSSGSGSILKVTKYDDSTVTIERDGSKIKLNGIPLTTVNVEATNLNFKLISGNPTGIIANVTIDGITATKTKYLRK